MTRRARACYALQQVISDEPSLRILIVDADAYFRRGLRETLHEAAGLRVVGEAADGDRALQLTRQLRRVAPAQSAHFAETGHCRRRYRP